MALKVYDLSQWQEGLNIKDLERLCDGVILRVGYTGYVSMKPTKDYMFDTFYQQAKKHGLGVGIYYYSLASDRTLAKAEVDFIKNQLKGKQLEYGVWIDIEDARLKDMKTQLTYTVNYWCELMENSGYYVGIYGSDIGTFRDMLNINSLTKYDKWVASYGRVPNYVKSYGIWQSTNVDRVANYNGNLDFNVCYKDYPSIMRNKGLCGYGTKQSKTKTYTYKVVKGDNLTKIANKYGVTVDSIVKENNIKNKNIIYAGDVLRITVKGE